MSRGSKSMVFLGVPNVFTHHFLPPCLMHSENSETVHGSTMKESISNEPHIDLSSRLGFFSDSLDGRAAWQVYIPLLKMAQWAFHAVEWSIPDHFQ